MSDINLAIPLIKEGQGKKKERFKKFVFILPIMILAILLGGAYFVIDLYTRETVVAASFLEIDANQQQQIQQVKGQLTEARKLEKVYQGLESVNQPILHTRVMEYFYNIVPTSIAITSYTMSNDGQGLISCLAQNEEAVVSLLDNFHDYHVFREVFISGFTVSEDNTVAFSVTFKFVEQEVKNND